MNLRSKALLGAIVLVALVCGALIHRVGRLYEDSERARIEILLNDLAVQQLQSLDDFRGRSAEALKRVFDDGAFQTLLRDASLPIKGNFLPKARACLDELKGADAALIAYDNLLAEERQAERLHVGADLSLCAAAARSDDQGRPLLEDEWLAALCRAPALWRLLEEVYAQKPPGEHGYSAYVPTGWALYLVVATPFAESLQEAGEPVGVGLAALAITDALLAERRSLKAEAHDRYLGGDPPGDPPEMLIHAGTRTVASTIDGPLEEALLLQTTLRRSGQGSFEIPVAPFFAPERYIALPVRIQDAAADTPEVGLITFKSLDRELAGLRRLQRDAGLAGLLLAVLGALAAYGLAVLVIRRLGRLETAARRVQAGDFGLRVDVGGRDEITRLGAAFNDMVGGLKALGLYTDPSIARRVVQDAGAGLYSARHEGSIFFSDIKDFTTISESLKAEDLTALLNEYFSVLGRCIADEGGYLDKFIGDAVMAFWGPPFVADGSHALRAARAALRCREQAAALRAEWQPRGRPLFFQRIGLATGEVVVGDLGSDAKRNFTVIGDAVNLASRLEGANKQHGTEILIDELTRLRAGPVLRTRPIGSIQVKGKAAPVDVHELQGLGGA